MVLKKTALNILYFIFLFDTFFIPPMHIYGVTFKLSYYIAFFSLIVKIISMLLNGKIIIKKEVFLLFTIAMLIFLGWLNYVRLQEDNSFRITFLYISIMLTGMGSYYFGSNFRFKKIYFSFPIIFLIINILLLIFIGKNTALSDFYYTTDKLTTQLNLRYTGMGVNPNATALIANILLIFTLLLIKNEKFKTGLKKYNFLNINLFLILPTSITIFLLQSRSGLACFALIVLIFYTQYYSNTRNLRKVKTILFFTLTILFFCLIFGSTVNLNILHNLGLGNLERIYSLQKGYEERINKFSASVYWSRIFYSPILGSGADISNSKPFDRYHYHNDYVALWSAGGIFALILYLIFIYFVVKKEPLLLPPFIFPGLTNAFLWNMIAFSTVLFLYSYSSNLYIGNKLKEKVL